MSAIDVLTCTKSVYMTLSLISDSASMLASR